MPVRQLLRLAQAVRLELAVTIGAGLLGGACTVWQAGCLSRVVSQVFLDGKTLPDVQPLLISLLALGAARAALGWLSETSANRAAGQVKQSLRQRLFARLLELGPAYTRGERSGELTNTLTEGIEALDAYFSQYLPQLALAALVPLTILIFVFPLDLISGLVFLLTAPLIPVFMILIGSLADALTRRQWSSLSRMSAHFLDVLQGLTTLKLFGRSRDQATVIHQVTEQFRQATLGVLRVAFLSALVLELVATLSTAVVAVQVGLRLLYARLSFEQAFFVLILAPEFYLPLRTLGARFHSRASALAAAARIFEILNFKFQIPDSRNTHHPIPNLQYLIRFDNVHYTYDDGQRPAANGVSFQLAPGQKVALVGPTGAGKSTLAQLLLCFIQPQRGQITVNGVSLAELSPTDWRAQVAWVPQNPYLFNASVAENIQKARPGSSQAEIERAARLAHAHEFIQELPQGYGTLIGERGARLSGGQAQRIALARAFLKDAPLLILDEATSNLDPEHEALIQESIEQLLQARTVLIIAHRLATVYRADQIVVMDEGRVVEIGTHRALMERDGVYRRLVGAYADEQPATSDQRPTTNDPTALISHSSLTINNPQLKINHSPSKINHSPLTINNSQLIISLLRLAEPFWPWMILATLLGFATIGSSIGLMSTSAFIIASAALHPSIADLQVAIVGVRFFGIARGGLRYLERYASHQVTLRLLARLRVWFYQALEPLAPARLMQYRSGDLLTRLVADIETLEHFYVRVLAPPVVAVLVGALMWILLGSLSLRLAATLLAFFLLAGAGVPLLARILSRAAGQRVVTVRAELNAALVDGIQGLADLLALGQANAHLRQVQALSQKLVRLQASLAWLGGLQNALVSLLMNMAIVAVLALAISMVGAGQLNGVYLAVLVLAALSSFEAVLPLPTAAQYLESNLQAARRLFDIIKVQPDFYPRSTEKAKENPPNLCIVNSDLVIEKLGFRYSPTQPPALDGISFTLPPGKRLAIVGPSGAGKTTLVNLLLRFWDYAEGQILLDGRDLRQYDPDAVRQLFGVVSQRTYLFNATIRGNLLLARPAATQAELEQAARLAQLEGFIQSLPQGYDTWIGEHGLRLSGGERQRLAIARALLKDAPFLILDEPTANLDTVTERQMLRAIYTLMQGRSTLLITHRLVGLELADEILVMQAGRVVQRGQHAGLLQTDGLYRRMWDWQNQVFSQLP